MYKTLLSLAPEQVFLVQGTKSFFKKTIESISENNPIIEFFEISRFTNHEASKLVTFNIDRAGSEVWYVVYFDIFIPEAAQVLLKTLEEPSLGIRIILMTPQPYLMPQTIRSRVRLVLNNIKSDINNVPLSKKTVTEYIKNVLGNENIDASDRRAQACELLNNIEYYVKNSPKKLSSLYDAKDMLFKGNMPTKQVMEYIVSIVF